MEIKWIRWEEEKVNPKNGKNDTDLYIRLGRSTFHKWIQIYLSFPLSLSHTHLLYIFSFAIPNISSSSSSISCSFFSQWSIYSFVFIDDDDDALSTPCLLGANIFNQTYITWLVRSSRSPLMMHLTKLIYSSLDLSTFISPVEWIQF